jgi:hypothetical protein
LHHLIFGKTGWRQFDLWKNGLAAIFRVFWQYGRSRASMADL